MAIDVDRAKFAQLQAAQARARNQKQRTLTTSSSLGRTARRFALPLLLATGTGFPSTPSPDEASETFSEQVAQDQLAKRQVQARLAMARALTANALASGQQATAQQAAGRQASLTRTVTQQIANQRQAAKAKKQDEEARRKLIRPAQASLFSGSVIGAETGIALVLGGGTWLAWKGLEGYKTLTGADLGIFEKFVVRWNMRETLTFIMGIIILGITTTIFVGFIILIGYFIVNPTELGQFFPDFASLFNTLL